MSAVRGAGGFLGGVNVGRISSSFGSSGQFKSNKRCHFRIPKVRSPGAVRTLLGRSTGRGVFVREIARAGKVVVLASSRVRRVIGLTVSCKYRLFLTMNPETACSASTAIRAGRKDEVKCHLENCSGLICTVRSMGETYELNIHKVLLCSRKLLFILGRVERSNRVPRGIRFGLSTRTNRSGPTSTGLLRSRKLGSLGPMESLRVPVLTTVESTYSLTVSLRARGPGSANNFVERCRIPGFVGITSPICLGANNSITTGRG